jgi:hypothetical protein
MAGLVRAIVIPGRAEGAGPESRCKFLTCNFRIEVFPIWIAFFD